MELTGKTLVFTDCHLGLNGGSSSRLEIVVSVFKEIEKAITRENISNVIFCGDAFHDRRSIDVNVLNVGHTLFSGLAKLCKVYLIVGNHDCHFKFNTSVNSVNIFNGIENFSIISEPTVCLLNGSKCLLAPWLTDFSRFEQKSFDLMFGHFDIEGKYLITSYIEEQSKRSRSNETLISEIINDNILTDQLSSDTYDQNKIQSLISGSQKSNDLVGNFVDYAKEGGWIYAGHIHQHKEFVSKNRNFIFVGSPYQQNFGEMFSDNGFYILDEQNKGKFYPILGIPQFKKIYISQILSTGIDEYDFSYIRGNIVRKVFDSEIDKLSETKINHKILDFSPYEELFPEYEIKSNTDEYSEEESNDVYELIKKSKLDYIHTFIFNIDEKSLTEQNIDKTKLFKILESYYTKAEDLERRTY